MDYGSLPAPHGIILAGGPETATIFRAIVIASVEAGGITGLQLRSMNPLCVLFAYTGRTIPVRNIEFTGLRIAPFHFAEEASVL
jgi:hypothetical protein